MLSKKELLMLRTSGKAYLENYLRELRFLCKSPISEDGLLTLEETYRLIDQIKARFNTPYVASGKFDFSEKQAIKNFVAEFQHFFEQGVYLFTEYSKCCGAFYLKSINSFNWDFEFDSEHAGIISIIDQDLSVKVLLDYYRDDSNLLLELEVYRFG